MHADWNKEFVPLPNNAQDQQTAASILTPLNGVNQSGLFIQSAVSKISFGIATVGSSKYQLISYTKADKTSVQLRYDASGSMQILNGSNWVTAYKNTTTGEWQNNLSTPVGASSAKFNGVIYSNDAVSSVYTQPNTVNGVASGNDKAIADFAQLTLSAANDIVITDNLQYEDPPCTGTSARNPICDTISDDGTMKKNILGIYSGTGDIEIANTGTTTQNVDPAAQTCTTVRGKTTCTSVAVNAPNNVSVDAVLMASRGAVQVQNYDKGLPRGALKLNGGIIENYYGAFFTFGAGSVQQSGFSRNYIYDPRMEVGFTPPSFPTQQNWIVGIDSHTSNISADAPALLALTAL